ncbi:MAG TPA: hypothetical protein VIG69_03620 [Candidatus Methylomirabilis sp.]
MNSPAAPVLASVAPVLAGRGPRAALRPDLRQAPAGAIEGAAGRLKAQDLLAERAAPVEGRPEEGP